MATVVVDEMLE
jgi:thioesterase domain-containing protein